MEIEEKITVTFNVKSNFVITKYNGQFSLHNALEAFDYVVNHNDHKRGMNRIWDISNAKFELDSNEEIELIANYVKVFPPEISRVKEAMVSEISYNWVLLKQFKLYAQNTPININIFENLQKAINWVTKK